MQIKFFYLYNHILMFVQTERLVSGVLICVIECKPVGLFNKKPYLIFLRYLFLNAIANQLRYPNSHTHYFSCCLLYLFAEANSEAVQEQITRMLLERLIVNRPHPWGLLITFIELIKNPIYKFWTHEFVHCAPEIEK